MKTFPLQSKVVEKKHLRAHYSYHAGEVIATAPDNHYIVEMYGHVTKHHCNDLLTESEAAVWQEHLETVQSQLDADFDKVRDQITAKMAEATLLVQEAAVLAESCKKDFSSLRNECRPLFRALNDAGWRASAMSC